MTELNKELNELEARMRVSAFIELVMLAGFGAAWIGVGFLAIRLWGWL